MIGHLKLGAAALAALVMAACTTSSADDEYRVGVNDDDQFSTAQDKGQLDSDVALSDAQTFGVGDDDGYDAVVTTTTVANADMAVAARVIRTDTTIAAGAPGLTNYTIVQDAIATAGLAETFNGEKNHTLFAPNNAAFAGMPLSSLSQAQLADTLKYHTVAGRLSHGALMQKLQANDGSYTVTTLQGGTLRFIDMDGTIKVVDRNGYTYKIDAPDNEFSNGVVHGIDGVLGHTF